VAQGLASEPGRHRLADGLRFLADSLHSIQPRHCREGAPIDRALPTSTSECGASAACLAFCPVLFPLADCPNDSAQFPCANANLYHPSLRVQCLCSDLGCRDGRPCDIYLFTAYRGSPERGDPNVKFDHTAKGDADTHGCDISPYRLERIRAYHSKRATGFDRCAWSASRIFFCRRNRQALWRSTHTRHCFHLHSHFRRGFPLILILAPLLYLLLHHGTVNTRII